MFDTGRRLIEKAVEEIKDHCNAGALVLGWEAANRDWHELELVNGSEQETADFAFNNVEILKDFIEGKLKGYPPELHYDILTVLYQEAHDALRIAILRIRDDDQSEYGFNPAHVSTTDTDLWREMKAPKKKKKIDDTRTQRQLICGLSSVKFIKAAVMLGYGKEQIANVCARVFEHMPAMGTIQVNMSEGKRGKNCPELSEDQKREIRRLFDETN